MSLTGTPGKRPTTAYGFFVKMCYEEHKKKYPNEHVQVTEISKKCSEKWKTMTDAEKRRFFELAQKDVERYQAECAMYGGSKRKRHKKDPNAPKRALSAFFFFSQEKRPEIQVGHPDWRVGQVAQELGRMWKDMTQEEKLIYEERATNDRDRYEHEMKDYKAGRPVASAIARQEAEARKQQAQQQAVMQHRMAAAAAAGMTSGVPGINAASAAQQVVQQAAAAYSQMSQIAMAGGVPGNMMGSPMGLAQQTSGQQGVNIGVHQAAAAHQQLIAAAAAGGMNLATIQQAVAAAAQQQQQQPNGPSSNPVQTALNNKAETTPGVPPCTVTSAVTTGGNQRSPAQMQHAGAAAVAENTQARKVVGGVAAHDESGPEDDEEDGEDLDGLDEPDDEEDD